MVLIFHIAIALTSVIFTTVGIFSPSRFKINLSYALATLTLSSGTYLVIVSHASLIRACFTGIVYLAIVFSGIFSAQHRLAKATNSQSI